MDDPLALDVQEMRALGRRIVDLATERMTQGRPGPVRITRDETEVVIPGGIAPRLARDLPSVGARLRAAVRERLPIV